MLKTYLMMMVLLLRNNMYFKNYCVEQIGLVNIVVKNVFVNLLKSLYQNVINTSMLKCLLKGE